MGGEDEGGGDDGGGEVGGGGVGVEVDEEVDGVGLVVDVVGGVGGRG